MGSENEIQKYELDGVDCMPYCYGGSPKMSEVPESEVEWSDPEDLLVRFSDHVAARKADQARIERAEGYVEYFRKQVGDLKQSLAAAEKLADAVEQSGGVAPGPGPIGSALAAFRASLSTGETD